MSHDETQPISVQAIETQPAATQPPTADVRRPRGLLVISCDTCVMAATSACEDCMMNVLMADDASEASGAVVLDLAEQRALRLLAQAGMVPTLRHRAAG